MVITTESPLLPWLVRQCDEPGGLLEPAQEGKARAFQVVLVQRIRPRTRSCTRVSETAAAAACEPELLSIHITDNHTKSLEHVQALQGRGKPTSEVRKLEE